MENFMFFIILGLVYTTYGHPSQLRTKNNDSLTIIPREEWGGTPPHSVSPLPTPVSVVVVHHTAVPGLCGTRDQCMRSMRSMQHTHQNVNGWEDIGYNFAVGGEGSGLAGRGWRAVGAHAAGVNNRSLGIALIGNFVSELPPKEAIAAAKQLIARGVKLGYISPTYRLVGHRQVGATECPGDTLYQDLKTWDGFSSTL